LEFDDNEKAQMYVEALQARIKDYPQAEPVPIAMFTKPSSLCECPVRPEKHVRGAKFGWWICPTCHKPNDRSPQWLNSIWPTPWKKGKWRMPNLSLSWKYDKNKKVVTITDE
jgi:hypothetical protein